ncbi:MAG: UvrB/UvrC motif-containing protein, partial [Komagataeibacter saccharivorans]
LEFETAARLRDEIRRLEALELGMVPPPLPQSSAGRPGTSPKAIARRNRGPVPLGPGGGGYDPEQAKGRGKRRGR